ncbi:hypothetical protein [uncultured Sneathiella sp.]|uniref:hypothetical protein n=1 Tax=uncultured Sneathiella sp. TaxID=879315 RepID=UPI0030EF67AE|tara:strand:- start:27928 stop:29226 length:1299 start_codon:yes stop_codon:yes gene_type:complete
MGIFSRQSTSETSASDGKETTGLGETILRASLADANLLIMTAAERGIPLDEDVTRAIFDTEDAMNKNMMTPAITNGFWQAYERLSHSLSPITVSSIRATRDLRQLKSGVWGYVQGKMHIPFSRKCAFRYQLLSILTLLSLITLQVFWAIGNTLVADIREQSNRIIVLKTQINNADSASHRTPTDGLPQRTVTGTETDDTTTDTSNNIPVTTSAALSDTQELNRQIDEYISWREAEFIELRNWNHQWGTVLFFTAQTWEKPDYSDLTDEEKIHVHYVSAQYVLYAISAYFLPILYGLLGASFFVLRQLPKDIEGLTFSMNSHIDYSLRITQGPLAGIMASFFFTTTPATLHTLTTQSSAIATIKIGSSSLSDFSPLAIAFLAGYSVELIFYVIDKIISAITTRAASTSTKLASQPQPQTKVVTAAKAGTKPDM